MSLINDALKKAGQSQSQTSSTGAPPLSPTEAKPQGASPWMLIVAVILFVASILFFFASNHPKQKNISAPVTNASAPALAQVEPLPQTNTSATAMASVITTNAPAEMVEQLPQVQGIIYDTARPIAIVDRKTLHIGDRDGTFKLIAISRNSVTFERADGSFKEIQIAGQ